MADRVKIVMINNPGGVSFLNFLASGTGYSLSVFYQFVMGTASTVVNPFYGYPIEVHVGVDGAATLLNLYNALVANQSDGNTVFTLGAGFISIDFVTPGSFTVVTGTGLSYFVAFTEVVVAPVVVLPFVNNTIHIINFSPRRYLLPPSAVKNYLVTESGDYLVTEDGRRIRV